MILKSPLTKTIATIRKRLWRSPLLPALVRLFLQGALKRTFSGISNTPFYRLGCSVLLPFLCYGVFGMAPASAHDQGQKLRALLLERDSATASLQSFCKTPIHAVLLHDHSIPDSALIASLNLSATSDAAITIRHVQLICGSTLLSEAWNAYVPNRLTPIARARLADKHTPFGRAVGSATFWRERLSSRVTGLPAGFILENRALLHRHTDSLPIAAVLERYTKDALPR